MILEQLRWRICRIWSTDWYRNPAAEIDPIIRELIELRTQPREEVIEPAETDELSEIVEQEVQQDLFVDEAVPETLDLRERLIQFDSDIIHAAFPNTPKHERLLRPAMLEALLEYMPVTKSEFLEVVPLYLRRATNTEEGKMFLDKVLKIIEEAETEITS